MRILHLSLKKEPFDVMATGEKPDEFRKPSRWILFRLHDKDFNNKKYDAVKLTNGYGNDKPFFIAEYKGWEFCGCPYTTEFSNGLSVHVAMDDVIIHLGKILEVGNYV